MLNKPHSAYGVVVNLKLKAVFLDKSAALEQCKYFRHLGEPEVVQLCSNLGVTVVNAKETKEEDNGFE